MTIDDGHDSQTAHPDTGATGVPGGEDGQTINLVFTGAELGAFVAYSALHGQASDWFARAPEPIPLADPAWMQAADPGSASDHQVFVVYGAPPSIEFTPANDSGGAMQESVSQLLVPDEGEALLASLGDDGLAGAMPVDALESLAAAAAAGGEGAETFVLTHINIGDLLSDIDNAADPGLPLGSAEFFEAALGPVSAPEPAILGNVTIEIEDDLGLAATHIVA